MASRRAAFRPTRGSKHGCPNSSIFCCWPASTWQHQVQSPAVIFTLFSAFSFSAPAKGVQTTAPPRQEGSGDFPAAPAVLTPASGLQKSLYSRGQGRKRMSNGAPEVLPLADLWSFPCVRAKFFP